MTYLWWTWLVLLIMICLAHVNLQSVAAEPNGNAPLSQVLHHYETLSSVHMEHTIVRRSADGRHADIRQVKFKSLGRQFHLYLQRSNKILASDFRVYTVNGNNQKTKLNVELDNLYRGYLQDEPSDTHVNAYWEDDDTLAATITTPQDTYVIEPSWRHLPKSANNHSMIAYKRSDVNFQKDMGESYCGYVSKHAGGSIQPEEDEQEEPAERVKRQAPLQSKPSKDTCTLLLVADYRFHKEMGMGNAYRTTSYLLGLADRVDSIYRRTDFGHGYKGMGFEVKEVLIHEVSTSSGGKPYYNEDRDWDTKDLLEAFSATGKIKQFCLAHLFTHIAFSSGTLGLAYIGSPRKYAVGGLGTKVYYVDRKPLYLNTGWSSSLNRYDRRLLTQEADLVTTHEFGHNWGSEHDPQTDECSPDGFHGGKHIMYTYSVSGYDTNNKDFSPCSKRSIGAVLRSKAQLCFVERTGAFCGNSRIEGEGDPEGEQCDGGQDGLDNLDPCCTPSCKFKGDSVCSDANHLCCIGCQVALKDVPCHLEQNGTCEGSASCDGLSAECPTPPAKDDKTPCLDKGECRGGQCVSFCASNNKESCVCEKFEDSCKWCCRDNQESVCRSFPGAANETLYLPKGMPCAQGLCNDQGECVKQVQDVMERLWSIIEDLTPSKFVELMRSNIVGTVLILSLFIWIPASCAISYVDRRRKSEDEGHRSWQSKENHNLVLARDKEKLGLNVKNVGHKSRGLLHLKIPAESVRQMGNQGRAVPPATHQPAAGYGPQYPTYRGPATTTSV